MQTFFVLIQRKNFRSRLNRNESRPYGNSCAGILMWNLCLSQRIGIRERLHIPPASTRNSRNCLQTSRQLKAFLNATHFAATRRRCANDKHSHLDNKVRGIREATSSIVMQIFVFAHECNAGVGVKSICSDHTAAFLFEWNSIQPASDRIVEYNQSVQLW